MLLRTCFECQCVRTHLGAKFTSKIVLAPIWLSNESPCSGVVVEANYIESNSNCHRSYRTFAGVYAAGAEGLVMQANSCDGCNDGRQSTDGRRICVPVATGAAPGSNSSMVDFVVQANTDGRGRTCGPEWRSRPITSVSH